MTTTGGAVPLGARRISGGHYQATWSLRPGVRVHVMIPAEAYDAATLVHLGEQVVDKLSAPHGQKITKRGSTP